AEKKTASRLAREAVPVLTPCYWIALCSGREIAELLEVRLLRLVARRQLEQARRGAAQDIVLAFLRHEREIVDGRGQVEVPVRIVRRVKELRFRIDHAERALQRAHVLDLH